MAISRRGVGVRAACRDERAVVAPCQSAEQRAREEEAADVASVARLVRDPSHSVSGVVGEVASLPWDDVCVWRLGICHCCAVTRLWQGLEAYELPRCATVRMWLTWEVVVAGSAWEIEI